MDTNQSTQGGLSYQGTWDARTNDPYLESGEGTVGHFYTVSNSGFSVIDALSNWHTNDWVIFNGSKWERIANTDSVISVNEKFGTVVLTTTDVAEGTKLYHTNRRVDARVTYETLRANGDVGISPIQLARGNHTHAGTYEPSDSNLLKRAHVTPVPVNDAVDSPISSNWSFGHDRDTEAHGGPYNFYTHPMDGPSPIESLAGATIFSKISVNGFGHITESATRILTPSDIGAASTTQLQILQEKIQSLESKITNLEIRIP